MASVRFELTNKYSDPSRETPVYVVLSDGKAFPKQRINTGLKVALKDWNNNKRLFRKTRNNYIKLNATLDSWKARISNDYSNLKATQRNPNKSDVKRMIKGIVSPFGETSNQTLDLLQEYAQGKGNENTDGTLKAYRTLHKHLTAFSLKTGRTVAFDNFDVSQYEAFTDYLYNRDLQDSTILNNQKKIIAFWKWAYKKEYHQNPEYLRFEKVPEPEKEITPLTYKELHQLQTLDLDALIPDNEGKRNALKLTRDYFIFLCLTGQRIGDLLSLKPKEHISSLPDKTRAKIWQLRQRKNKKKVSVPLLPEVLDILKLHNGKLIYRANATLNRELKELARLANLNRIVDKVTTKRSKQTVKRVPLHTIITTHTGRKTFINRFQEIGMPPHEVDAITGHAKTTVKTRYYQNISEQHLHTQLTHFWEKLKGKYGR